MLDAEVPVVAVELDGLSTRFERPASCPSCKKVSAFSTRNAARVAANREIEVVLQCGDERCLRHFIVIYSGASGHALMAVGPLGCDTRGSLQDFSNLAAELFAEAEAARQAGSVRLAALGYRSALEALAAAIANRQEPDLRAASDALKAAEVAKRTPSESRTAASIAKAVPHYQS